MAGLFFNVTYKVYILQNLKGMFYIGPSENVEVRLKQHNAGFSKWTRCFEETEGGRGSYQIMGLLHSSGS